MTSADDPVTSDPVANDPVADNAVTGVDGSAARADGPRRPAPVGAWPAGAEAWAGTGFETVAIHAGQDPDPVTGAVVVPIHPSSTFAQDAVGVPRGAYEYARSSNPTRTALETSLAALEAGAVGLAFASGMAAVDAVLRTVCRPGDHAVIPLDAYGGTYRLFSRVLAEWGVEYTPAPLNDLDAVRAAIRPGRTRLLWSETPTNPTLGVSDIAALADIAHSADALLVVDNTFATPYLQQPLALGADVTVHSTTKYLGGHSDVVGGAAVVADPGLGERLRFIQNATGAVPSPFDAWLVLRGAKTLAVRMDRHCTNARRVAELLAGHPAVAAVHYPGLPDDPGHQVAAKQMRDFGGMVSFALRGGEEAAVEVCRRTRVFTLAESLGGVESLIEHPGRMTHVSVAGSPLEVPANLIRLSVGIESIDDLLEDLTEALPDRRDP
ncbi:MULTISPECIES: cystathionine gamma-synthase [Protofrankia]|uniref:Cystathionine gamma-lyase n=1 Tax=Candidatus Protofrankia datiscae TaxID=2716812 RepID=F8AVD9_9ACTN|nr:MULTISPECIES: cystathionine gamma-synthase [Protofrankia]AEH08235.1 Cystathionine gamma-lyase [Candidatus Protofrankia datiscae]